MAEENVEVSNDVEDRKAPVVDDEPPSLSQRWTDLINAMRMPFMRVILATADWSAKHPIITIITVILLSFGLVVIGLFTNFSVDVDEDVLWTPRGTRPLSHNDWINDVSGFPTTPRRMYLLIHADGQNVVAMEAIKRSFTAFDTVRNTPKYDMVCAATDTHKACEIVGVTQFWNNSVTAYEAAITTDQQLITILSNETFPDGTPVDRNTVLGFADFDASGQITSAKSFFINIDFPETTDAEAFEADALDNVLALKDIWLAEPNNIYRVEIFAERSFADEFTQAIVNDIPLVPAVFVVMSIFTCIVFFRRDWVYSRSLMGFGAVVSVLLAIMTGYGLMFVIGVPFTSMSQILPFIVFGIGLDDAFIITGQYARTDKSLSPEERIIETLDEVGLSVMLTTVTSVVAFGLGCMSRVPAVYWLCLYAFPTIFIDFLYQITFFVAIVVLDERRVAAKRRDCCVCCTVQSRVDSDEVDREPEESSFDRFMGWFADQLFRPWMKVLVIVAFTGLLGACAYSASQLTQAFDFTDVVPTGSYVTDFWDSFDAYTRQTGIFPGVYFRDVDQSDPAIQAQMQTYVDNLTALPQITDAPTFFWLRDFKTFVNDTASVQSLAFNDQLTAFLDDPVYSSLYSEDIVRDANGNIFASRTSILMDQVAQEDVTAQINALRDQSDVGSMQAINQGRSDWAFFTFDTLYFIWEFYSTAEQELLTTTILGIASVTAIALLLIPHWSAAFFVLPLITILYVDLMGVLNFAGININAVSYISLVMSIGLLVDFLMHVLLRYYESPMEGREAKVKDTLKTMGSSILVGAISTFLGVIPLAFSSSAVFSTVFVAFIGLVTLGAGHGLILIPVMLSIIGPNVCIRPDLKEKHVKGQE